KFRNTARFMLGNLYDFDPATSSVAPEALSEVDQWALLRTSRLLEKVYRWYEEYEFHRIYHAVYDFFAVDLSAFYLNILQDRPYPAAPRSEIRRSSPTVLYQILDALTRAMAPIYSFTCDEIWQHLPQSLDRAESVHIAQFVPAGQLIQGVPGEALSRLA